MSHQVLQVSSDTASSILSVLFGAGKEMSEQAGSPSDDYYGFLNVSKTASAEEIRNAYKVLSKRFHPDKHRESTDESLKAAAETLFQRLKHIYDVLSDPAKRAIYDSVGAAGVEGDHANQAEWTLIMRHCKSAEELKAQWEAFQRQKAAELANALSTVRGTLSALVDATDVFEHRSQPPGSLYLPSLEVRSLSMAQSLSTEQISLSGNVAVSNGIGSGTVAASLRHTLSPSASCEVELAVGQGPILATKYFHSLSPRLHFSAQSFAHYTPFGIRPGLIFVVSRQFSPNLVGQVILKLGSLSSLSTMLVFENEQCRLNGSVSLGGMSGGTFLSASYTHKWPSLSAAGKVGLKVALSGSLMLEYGLEGEVSPGWVAGAAMSVGSQSGVALRLKLSRQQQCLVLPILLSSRVRMVSVFYGSTLPLIVGALLRQFLFEPARAAQAAAQATGSARAHSLAHTQALLYRRLMDSAYQLMMQRQTSAADGAGLIVQLALYGATEAVLTAARTAATGGPHHQQQQPLESDGVNQVFEVTVPVQLMLNESTGTLSFSDANKSTLPGFYDCAPGQAKQLLVRYRHQGQDYQVMLSQREAALFPSQAHLINKSN